MRDFCRCWAICFHFKANSRLIAFLCVVALIGYVAVYKFAWKVIDLHGDEIKNFDFEGRQHDDPELIKYIRSRMIHPPKDPLPYNLVFPGEKDFSKHGQFAELTKIFGDKTKGYFIEAGAFTGEDYSSTLFWERERNWTGILIEPHPYYYSLLQGKNRRAIILNAGLSPTNTANTLTFTNDGWGSQIVKDPSSLKSMPPSKYFTVPCFPLTSILIALGKTHVDLVSLDIETYELPVLKTMNLSALDLNVIMTECLTGCGFITQHMLANGYKLWKQLTYDGVYKKL